MSGLTNEPVLLCSGAARAALRLPAAFCFCSTLADCFGRGETLFVWPKIFASLVTRTLSFRLLEVIVYVGAHCSLKALHLPCTYPLCWIGKPR